MGSSLVHVRVRVRTTQSIIRKRKTSMPSVEFETANSVSERPPKTT